jgi:hypothetical protein
MKAFLQHNNSGLYYQANGEWGHDLQCALEFGSAADAERFRATQEIPAVHPVLRIDPNLLARMSARAPGVYQVGE